MAFKMKGWSGFTNSPAPQKKKPDESYTKEDLDFLKEQKEERVKSTDYLSKTRKGPVKDEKFTKKQIESTKYFDDAQDELEFLNEDLFNEKITKAEYDAKKKILDMKTEAGKKAMKS